MQLEHNEYIQEVSVPFCIKVFSKEQFHVLDAQKNAGVLPIIYFDATGTVVKKPFDETNRVHYYTAVVPVVGNKRIFPVFEMVSSDHHTKTIFKIFHDFKVFCEENNKWPIFGKVVTDFSFANIHAIVKVCNAMNLVDYLTLSYNIVVGKVNFPKNLVTLHLCCAHFMKMVAKDVDGHYTNFETAMTIKDLLAICITIKRMEDLSDWVFNVTILLASPFYTTKVKAAYDNLLTTKLDKYTGKSNNFPSESDTLKVDTAEEPKSVLYKSSLLQTF